jgi:methionyl-tRNA formyltransferase
MTADQAVKVRGSRPTRAEPATGHAHDEKCATVGMSRVLLVGKGPSARTALESLAEKFDVVGVIRSPRPRRGQEDEVQRCAHELGVPVLTDTSLQGVERAIVRHRPDCVVISSYDRILNARILDRSRFVNVHYAPLPRYRGLAAIQWGIINGESKFGITVHVMTKDVDAGNILYQNTVTAGRDETAGDIYSRLNEIQRSVLGETVERHLGGYPGVPQDDSLATYACARTPADSEINWSDSTDRIHALIRAFHEALSIPYPEAYTYLKARRISIIRAEPVQNAPHYAGRVPGRVVGRSAARGYVDVLSGDGILRIHEVVPDDSVVRPASAVITSTQQTLGLQAGDLFEQIDALSRQLNQFMAGAGPVSLPADTRPPHETAGRYSRSFTSR